MDHVNQYRRPETSLKAGSEGVHETDEDYDTRRRRIWPYTKDTRVPAVAVSSQKVDTGSSPSIDEDAQLQRIEAIRQRRKQQMEEQQKKSEARPSR